MELGKLDDWLHLDSDQFYWKKTDPPFQEKILLAERNGSLRSHFISRKKVVLSGSMISWGKEWESSFDLAVFLHVPPSIRNERLRIREIERYGKLLETDKTVAKTSKSFLDWATQYDDEKFRSSITRDREWIKRIECPVLKIEGDISVAQRLDLLLNKIDEFHIE